MGNIRAASNRCRRPKAVIQLIHLIPLIPLQISTDTLAVTWSLRYRLQQRHLGKSLMAHDTPEAAKTLSVPEAGKRYFGLSRGSSYAAAANGEIPTVRIGKLLRVPVMAMERILERAGEPE